LNSNKYNNNNELNQNTSHIEAVFYEKLFVENPNWSGRSPNDDEAARWGCISSLLNEITDKNFKNKKTKYRIIDVGCGRGWLSNLLTEYGSVEGVEPIATVVNHARRLFPNVKFYQGDVETIIMSPDFCAYEIVVCSEVIEHVPDSGKKKFAKTLVDLLKPGGYLILTTPRQEAQHDWLKHCGAPGQPVEDWLNEKQVESLFSEEGLIIKNLKKIDFEGELKIFVTNKTQTLPPEPKLISIYQVWLFQKPNDKLTQTNYFLEAANIAFSNNKINDACGYVLKAQEIKANQAKIAEFIDDIASQSNVENDNHKWLCEMSNAQPENPDFALSWAKAANKAQNSEEFERALNRVLSKHPTHRGAHKLIAETFIEVGKYGKAAPIYHSLAIQDPSDVEALLGLAKCLISGSEWESAMAVLNAALDAKPSNTVVARMMNDVQTQLKKSDSQKVQSIAKASLDISVEEFDYINTPASDSRPEYNYLIKNTDNSVCVSIITPFYNISELFHETAKSILNQSMQNYEWIIINDGSSDPRSINILNEYRNKTNRIRVVDHELNLGLSAARNTGFREAQTEYVVQLDGDDLLEPTTIEKWYWYLESHPQTPFVNSYSIGFGDKCYLWNRGFETGKAFLEENQVPAFAMIRRSVHKLVGGYDETIKEGLEDWDFWLRCANKNLWGKTINEFHSWYRRRGEPSDRWAALKSDRVALMREQFQKKYSRLWKGSFPTEKKIVNKPYTQIRVNTSSTGVMAKIKPRLILIIPWMTVGGADKFNIDLISQLGVQGWEITVVATLAGDQSWMGMFTRITPDVFVLPNFLEPIDYPRFLQHLVISRNADVVMVSHSEWGYRLLPFLRSHCPDVVLVDYCHIEEESWNNGGYPRYSLQYQEILDLTLVSSIHLKNWMESRGANNDKVIVCTTNVDPNRWKPSNKSKAFTKKNLGLIEDRPVILFAARMVPQKQPRVLAETLRRLRDRGVSFIALVVGGGIEENWFKEFVLQHNLASEVLILGQQSNETVARLLDSADVFFLPSLNEGIAITLYEAMAAGVAIVGADVGGQAELVTKECGFLIKPTTVEEDAIQYVNIIQSLLSDPSNLRTMGDAGRKRIESHFSLQIMGEKIDKLLKQKCKSKNKCIKLPTGIGLICASEAIELERYKVRDPLEAVCIAANISAQSGALEIAFGNYQLAKKMALCKNEHNLADEIDMVVNRIRKDNRMGITYSQPEQMNSIRPNKESGIAESPLVTIVIICFKQAHLLQDSVHSVLSQKYKNWELIIVNDGSPDNVIDVAQDLIAKNVGYNIRIVNKQNGGQADARNKGFELASGSLFLPLDCDDCLHPNYLVKTVAALRDAPGAGIAYTDIQHFGTRRDVWITGPFTEEVMVRDNRLPYCSLYRRSLFDSVGGYSNEMRGEYEDWDFWLAALEKRWTAIKVSEPLFLYRKHGEGMLGIANSKREALVKKIINRHPVLCFSKSEMYSGKEKNKLITSVDSSSCKIKLNIVYLISSIQGVTGGNQTLLGQTNKLSDQGHEVSIVTYSDPPPWLVLKARIIKVPSDQPMSNSVPIADIVVATYFTNAIELERINVPVKVYYAQGDQYVFDDSQLYLNSSKINFQLAKISEKSYQQNGVYFVANSRNLASAVETKYGRKADGIVPVCTDRNVFFPSPDRKWLPPWRILIVGPDSRGNANEPLTFKGISDIKDAISILRKRRSDFEIVRISNTLPEIFKDVACKFYVAPTVQTKTQLYGTSHVLIYASHYDSCPRPPQEAMASGVAVVCTNTGGAREYCKNRENSLLVPIRDPNAIADAVELILDNNKLRDHIVRGGFITAAEFSSEREWNEWEVLLKQFYQTSQKI